MLTTCDDDDMRPNVDAAAVLPNDLLIASRVTDESACCIRRLICSADLADFCSTDAAPAAALSFDDVGIVNDASVGAFMPAVDGVGLLSNVVAVAGFVAGGVFSS